MLFNKLTVLFKESYEVYTMGENTNGNLGHSQVNKTKLCKDFILFPLNLFTSRQLKKCLN